MLSREQQRNLREEPVRLAGKSERPILVLTSGNAERAKGPHFKVSVTSGGKPGDWR
jgi:hypothetical protein